MPVSAEHHLISSAIRNSEVGLIIDEGLEPYHFRSCLEEFQFLFDFYKRYKRGPSRQVFKSNFPEFPIRATDDTAYYIDQVRKAHAKRLLMAAAKDVADFITGDGEIEEAQDRFQKALLKVASETARSEDTDIFTDNAKIVKSVIAKRQRFLERGFSGIPTGIPTVDAYTGGAAPGETWVIALRQGEGKSYTMQTMACAAAMRKNRVLFNALEQTREQVSLRIFGMMSGKIGQQVFSADKLMRGDGFDIKDFKTFLRTMKAEYRKTGTEAIHVSDRRSAHSVMGFMAQIEKHEPDIQYIDYLQRVKGSGSYAEERSRYAEVSEAVANMAIDYDMPIILASQMNRDTLSKSGGLGGTENFSGSDKIGDDASVALIGVRQSEHVRYFKCAKNRNGQDGWGFYIHYDPSQAIFQEIDAEKASDIADIDAYETKKNARVKRVQK